MVKYTDLEFITNEWLMGRLTAEPPLHFQKSTEEQFRKKNT